MNDYGGKENIIISCTISQHKAAYLCNLFQFNESNNTASQQQSLQYLHMMVNDEHTYAS